MAYFRKLKLDPNFEDWLDSRIVKLKAEGVIESDPEDGEEEEEVVGEEFVWGEDPQQEQEVTDTPLPERGTDQEQDLSGHDRDKMATVSSGGKLRTVSGADELATSGADPDQYRHISTEIGGDYYQFVWDEDDEADIFDREEYKLGHAPTYEDDIANGIHPDDITGLGQYEPHIVPNVRVTHPSNHDNPTGDTYHPSSSRVGGALSGVVLGVGRRDVRVAYTQLQGGPRRTQEDTLEDGSTQDRKYYEKDWDFEVQDDLDLPDPRFSISDQGYTSHDVPMLELPPTSGKRRRDRRRSARVRDADTRGTAASGLPPPEGDTVGDLSLQDLPQGGGYGRGRLLNCDM